MTFTIGENVGPYRIVEKLGQGGMATVFKAYHPSLDRYVAIKVLHPAFLQDPNFLARFQREARIVARLDHPNIVPVYDFAEHQGHPYLVMRFIEGDTLKARLHQGPVELAEVLRLLEAVGGALAYAHRQGILHRDIKPSNVILTPDGHVYLTDFGLARMAEVGETTMSRDMLVGTPQYIAPEQARGDAQLDARTDIYSLGVVLYELLVGRVPFQADTPYAIIHDHIFTPLPMPRAVRPELSEPLERVLLKALAKDSADRFASVEELLSAFRTAAGSDPSPVEAVAVPVPEVPVVPPPEVAPAAVEAAEPVAAPPAAPPMRKKRRRWLWVVPVVLVMLCICLTLAALRGRQRDGQGAGDGEDSTPAPPAVETVPPPGEALPSTQPPPTDTAQWLADAQAAQDQGNDELALELYRQVIAADPQSTHAYLEVADLLLRGDGLEEAVDLLQQGVDANPANVDLHRRLAETAVMAEDWDLASREVGWLLEQTPDDPLPHAYAALIVLLQGQPCADAQAELERALELAPDLSWAHYGLALCHLQADDVEAAREELEFVLGQEQVPPLLRLRAEQLLGAAEDGGRLDVGRQLLALGQMVTEIPDVGLRTELRAILEPARLAWEERREQETVEQLNEALAWVEGHAQELGEPLGGELRALLQETVDMLGRP